MIIIRMRRNSILRVPNFDLIGDERMTPAKKGIYCSILFVILTINLVLFDMILVLLLPIWYDIDKFLNEATGITTNWALAIFMLTVVLFVYSGRQVYVAIKKIKTNQAYKPRLVDKIMLFSVLIVWNSMLFLLFTELGSEIAILKLQFKEFLNWILLIIVLIALALLLQFTNIWKNKLVRFGVLIVISILVGWNMINPGPPKVVAGPYLHAPTENSITVGWITKANAVSWVEYGENGKLDKKAFTTEKGLIGANQTVNKIKIEGLEPGKTYDYRIVSKKVKRQYPYDIGFGKTLYGEVFSFNTLNQDKNEISFLVINDIHENVNLLTKLVEAEADKPYDFVVFNGDAFNYLMNETQLVQSFLKPVSELFASEVPFILVRGNHETRGKFARQLPDYIDTPNAEYYYSFKHGPAEFLILDTGEDKADDHVEYFGLTDFDAYRERETDWLKGIVSEKDYNTADFRVALSHIPLNEFQMEERLDPIAPYQKEWAELLSNSELDLLLSGHYHINNVYEPKGAVGFPVILGGGEAYEEGNYSILRVDITRDKIEIHNTDEQGNVKDSKKIEKRKVVEE